MMPLDASAAEVATAAEDERRGAIDLCIAAWEAAGRPVTKASSAGRRAVVACLREMERASITSADLGPAFRRN